jgi:hypothetical protein
MPEMVTGALEASSLEKTFDDDVEPPSGESVAPGVEEDCPVRCVAVGEQRQESHLSPFGDRDKALTPTLAPANQDAVRSDVFEVDRHKLRGPDPGADQDFENGPVSLGEAW